MFLLVAIARRKLADNASSIKIGHAVAARDEMRTIADEFRELARRSGIATSAIDQLRNYSDTNKPSADRESDPHIKALDGLSREVQAPS